MKHYDVIIVGAGPAGMFTAYKLITTKPELKILLCEQGNSIKNRECPIIAKKVTTCINCDKCAITTGAGGAGAFSDGKASLSTAFGGWLNEYIPDEEVMQLIQEVDDINLKFGAPNKVYYPKDKNIKTEALKYDLHLLEAPIRHLGTENNLKMLIKYFDFLEDKIEIRYNTTVDHIIDNHTIQIKEEQIQCDFLVVAPGRVGSEWFAKECQNLNIAVDNNRVDIGVRVELPAEVFKNITDNLYEAKLLYRTKCYGDIVRTFCMNPYGHVVTENSKGIITVNGHSYADEALRSNNTNFALLVSNKFTEPFDNPQQYGKRIASLSNLLGNGVIVQRLGDLLKGRRTNEHRLSKSFTIPTLKATAGDLSLVLPKRHLDNIIEMLKALDKLCPGTYNEDTLLYGVEVKFYSSKVEINNHLRTKNGIYAIGDGSGLTRGLTQASASGLYVAREILKQVRTPIIEDCTLHIRKNNSPTIVTCLHV